MLTKDQQLEKAARMLAELYSTPQQLAFTEMLDAARFELLLNRYDKDYAQGVKDAA